MAAVVAAAALTAGAAGLLWPAEGLQDALDALAVGNLARAERIAGDLVRRDPDAAARAWVIVATASHRAGRYDRAEDAYRQFLAICDDPDQQAYAAEQIAACRRLAQPPQALPPGARLTGAQRAKLAVVDNRRHAESTEHFIVRANNAALARLVADQAENALERICESILGGQAYPHSVRIDIWATVAEFRRHATSAREWAGGSFSLRRGAGGRTVRRIDLTQLDDAGRFDVRMLDRVLPHEMCHLVLAEFFGDASCPTALSEGLAMLAEASADNGRIALAGAAMANGQKISLADMLTMDRCGEKQAPVFYAEAFSLADYLRSRMTRRQFAEMLGHLKAGCPLDEAIQRAMYVPPRSGFLDQLARAWEAEAIRQSQFLRALDEGPEAAR